VAPFAVTAPLARRPFEVLGPILMQAWQEGELTLPYTEAELPASIVHHMASWESETGAAVPIVPLYALIVGWTHIHGMVTLELFHHLQPAIGDTAALYQHEVARFLDQLGLPSG